MHGNYYHLYIRDVKLISTLHYLFLVINRKITFEHVFLTYINFRFINMLRRRVFQIKIPVLIIYVKIKYYFTIKDSPEVKFSKRIEHKF